MAFPGTGKIWMNGKLVEWKDATIHIASHVIHYGSGVFEGARCYATPRGSACFRLDAHMRRLQHSMKIYRMDYALDLAGWQNAVLETIREPRLATRDPRPATLRQAQGRPEHRRGTNSEPPCHWPQNSRRGYAKICVRFI